MTIRTSLLAYSQDLWWAITHCRGIGSRTRLIRDFTLARLGRIAPGVLNDRETRVDLRDGTTIVYRLNRCDLWTIHEVWVRQEYSLPSDLQPTLVVDLGANVGITAISLARRFGAEVIAVEPSSSNASMLRKNFEANGIRGRVVEAAVGAADGTGSFLKGPGATCGRVDFNGEFDARQRVAEQAVDVPIVSMRTVLQSLPDDQRIGLLKIDIEGGEDELFNGDLAWLDRVDFIVIELHPELIDYRRAVATLGEAGFRKEFARPAGRDRIEGYRRLTSRQSELMMQSHLGIGLASEPAFVGPR